MEELIKKLENLKKSLDKNQSIKEIKKLNKKIKNNQELVNKINKYNLTKSEEDKQNIIKNKTIIKYKHLEVEVNFLILQINKQLKELSSKKGCGL